MTVANSQVLCPLIQKNLVSLPPNQRFEQRKETKSLTTNKNIMRAKQQIPFLKKNESHSLYNMFKWSKYLRKFFDSLTDMKKVSH